MAALSLKRSIKPVLQVKSVGFAVVLRHMKVRDMNLEAFAAVFVLEMALKLH
jgi:hypothetical protein